MKLEIGQQWQNNHSKNIYTITGILGYKIYFNNLTYVQHNSLEKYFKQL